MQLRVCGNHHNAERVEMDWKFDVRSEPDSIVKLELHWTQEGKERKGHQD